MDDPPPGTPRLPPDLFSYPLLEALRQRRSRRFGRGMTIPDGPLAYASKLQPCALTEAQEATLAYAACGMTGQALAELAYGPAGGGNIMAGWVARTIASGDGLQSVALIVINDQGAHLVRRARELPANDVAELIRQGQQGALTEVYRRSRIRIADTRVAPPPDPLFNLTINRWSAAAAGTSYFLPINDLSFLYINGLLEIFNEATAAFVVDERNFYRPAGLASFARSRGGHLNDDPRQFRVATIRQVEQFVTEFVCAEQGMMLQNLGLMAEALGLGGFPNFANHEFGWFQALGFRMAHLPANQYLGTGRLTALAMKLLRRNPLVPYPLGLERDGAILLRPFCPPYFPSMAEAVRAVVAAKFGPEGVFRHPQPGGAWLEAGAVTKQVAGLSEAAIRATIAYCEYVWNRYRRFPAHLAPYRTVLGFQACHLDRDFYRRFYRPEALGSRPDPLDGG